MDGSNNTIPIIMVGLSFCLIIIFILFIALYFGVLNQSPTHDIMITNKCAENIFVRFGAFTNNNTTNFLPANLLSPGQTLTYKATPGSILTIKGYYEGDLGSIDSVNTLTNVKLTLAGEGFNGKSRITDGNNIIGNLSISRSSSDIYGVSLQVGYNIPITIESTANNNRNDADKFSCIGPEWNHTINGTGTNVCPTVLIYPGFILNPDGPPVYQSCSTPCTAIGGTGYCCLETNVCNMTEGCETEWPIPEYYDVFADACPDCLITECDNPNYTCSSNNGLTSYTITFCPPLMDE